MNKLIVASVVILPLPWVWLAAASALYCYATDNLNFYVFPWMQWLDVIPILNTNLATKFWFFASAAVASLPLLLVARIAFVRMGDKLSRPFGGGLRRQERGVTTNFGDSRLATTREMKRKFPGPSGLVIGRIGRWPWSKLLIDLCKNGSTHTIVAASPGSHKTTTGVTTVWHWPGPVVVFDPSDEIGPIMEDALLKRGSIVKKIGVNHGGINVISWIKKTHPEAEIRIRTATEWLYNKETAEEAHKSDGNPFWEQQGKALIYCLLAHVIFDAPNIYENKNYSKVNLATFRELMSTPEDTFKRKLLPYIHSTSTSKMARDIAGSIMEMGAKETFSGIYSNANGGTAWLGTQAYADLVSGDDFDPAELVMDDYKIFVPIKLFTLMATPTVGKAILGAMLNSVYEADGFGRSERILFLIDEAATFGPMREILFAFQTARKYRATMQLFYQSEGQFEAVWGEKQAVFLRDSVSWRAYSGVQDPGVAEKVSLAYGTHSVVAYSQGQNQGTSRQAKSGWFGSSSQGQNRSKQEVQRRLVMPHEVLQAGPDQYFVFPKNSMPMKVWSAPYFKLWGIRGQMSASRFQ